jgi:hypothetical protein
MKRIVALCTAVLTLASMTAATASAATIIKEPGVASCLKKRFGANVYASPRPHDGWGMEESPPGSFGNASGGWIVVNMPRAQEATLLFYTSMLEADRMEYDISFTWDFAFRRKNVCLVYEHKPTRWEKTVIARCLPK